MAAGVITTISWMESEVIRSTEEQELKKDVDVEHELKHVEIVPLGPTTVYVGGYNNQTGSINTAEKYDPASNE